MDKSLLGLKRFMTKTEQLRLCQGFRNLETCSAMRYPTQMFFYQLRFKNDSFITGQDLAM